jgi:hypothetical protein
MPRPRRIWILVCLFAGLAATYGLLLLVLSAGGAPRELVFAAHKAGARDVALYIEPLSVDAVNDALHVRVTPSPGPDLQGHLPEVADSDVMIIVGQGTAEQPISLHAHETMPAAELELSFDDGNVADYPFDEYSTSVRLRALEAKADLREARVLPVVVTFWEGLYGYRATAQEAQSAADGEVWLRIDVRRTSAFRYFATAVYLVMFVFAAAGLTIGERAFLGARPPEPTLIGALAAMVFALPILRNALPGAPPVGVRADLLVFLWAIIATALALILLVYSWARERH